MKLIASSSFALSLMFVTQPAFAFSWTYLGQSKELIGSTGEDEGDTDFRAACRPGGKAEIGIGAAEGIGAGEGEAVSVRLAAGAQTLTIGGHSRKSPNFEMTAGVELQTVLDAKHALFRLLAEPGAIKVSGKTIKATWPATDRAAATRAFVKTCFGG